MIIVTFHRETREVTVNFTSDEGPHGSTGFLQLVEALGTPEVESWRDLKLYRELWGNKNIEYREVV